MTAIRLERRSVPGQLRYLAAKLREGDRYREPSGLALDVLADELNGQAACVTDADRVRSAAAVLRKRMKARGRETFTGLVFVRVLERWADREEER